MRRYLEKVVARWDVGLAEISQVKKPVFYFFAFVLIIICNWPWLLTGRIFELLGKTGPGAPYAVCMQFANGHIPSCMSWPNRVKKLR